MKLKKFIIAFVFLLGLLIVSRDLFKPGYFSMHDDLQIGRLYEMDLCFRDGQIPCRWVPDMGYSYGYPLFNYYPPFPYYLGEIVHLTGFSFIDSTKIVFFLGFLVSGLLMFLFARKIWGDWGGLLSAILYLFAPYHSVDIYVRGAMNEFWALAFFPGVLWAVYGIIEKRSSKSFFSKDNVQYVFLLALFYGLLLLSHNIMALIFTPVVVAFSLLLIWLKKADLKEKILKLAIGGLWGVGLASFFTIPVLLEKKFVHVETMLMGYFNYLAHYVSVPKMLFTRFWGYGSSGWLQETGMPFQVGIPQWPLAVLALFLILIFFLKKKNEKVFNFKFPNIKIEKEFLFLEIFFVALFFFTLFLVHPRSVLIWNFIPPLAYLQFPWRFLSLVIFAISIAGGGIILLINKEKSKMHLSLFLIIMTILLNYSFFRVEKNLQVTDEQKLFSAKGFNKLQTDAIFDYLPLYAKAPPGGPAPSKPEIKEGNAEIGEINKGTNWYRFNVKVDKEAKLQIPVYDFPGWEAKIDNKQTSISHDNFLGLITVVVPSGEHEVSLKLKNTFVRNLGNFSSLISWIILLSLSVKLILNKNKK